MDIVISGAIANFSSLSTLNFFEFIKQKDQKIEFYRFKSTEGMVSSAAFDWKIVTRAASVLSIISFIWLAYNELIKPNKTEESDSGIIIQIENFEVNNYYWIGKDIKTEKELYEKINNLIKDSTNNKQKVIKEIDTIKNSKNWKLF